MAKKIRVDLEVKDRGSKDVKKFSKATQTSFKKLKKSTTDVNKGFAKSTQRIKQMKAAITAMAAVVVVSIGKKAVDAASKFEEVVSKFEVVFKDQQEKAEEFSKTLVDSFGLSERAAKQYLSSVQDLLVPMGMASDAAADMSNKIVKLSVDLGSFNDQPTARVMSDIQSALVGNYETMKKYGVVLNATNVQQRALNMGLAKTKDSLTAAHKAQAAYKLIMEGSQAAIGDWARTSESYANILKQISGSAENLAKELGIWLLPVLGDIGKELIFVIKWWTEYIKTANKATTSGQHQEYILKQMKQQQALLTEEIEKHNRLVVIQSKWLFKFADDSRKADIKSQIEAAQKSIDITKLRFETLKQLLKKEAEVIKKSLDENLKITPSIEPIDTKWVDELISADLAIKEFELMEQSQWSVYGSMIENINKYTEASNEAIAKEREAYDKSLEAQEAAAAKMKEVWKGVGDKLESTLVSGLADMVLEAKSAEDAFASMAKAMARYLVELGIQLMITGTIKRSFGFKHGGITPEMPGAAEGAVFKGPTSGYPVMMHGNEAVIPLKNGAVPVDMQGATGGISNNITVNVRQDPGGDPAQAKETGNIVSKIIRQEMDKWGRHQLKPGGMYNRSPQGA